MTNNQQAKTPLEVEQLSIDAIRVLAMDAVQKADSGHPGTPMALAPLAYVLWTRHLRYDPGAPDWANRDRFVLSAGHASMLLYSVLYLTGYDLTLDDIKQFRQWESRTPGHPEYGYTPGVETTTGPLGQGFGNAVGLAIAEAHLAARFNRDGHAIVDHHTYFIASDGDLMEGLSHEAASYAGHLELGKLIGFYDDNHITIEGTTDLTYSDEAATRFSAYDWHVQRVDDANDIEALDRATVAAKNETRRPSLIIVRSHIGYPSPNKQDTAEAHGAPLGQDEVRLTKQKLGYPSLEPFYVDEHALEHWRAAGRKAAKAHAAWNARWREYQSACPEEAAELDRRLHRKLPSDWEDAIPTFTAENGKVATRAASGVVLNAIAPKIPELIGGSADLASSTNTLIKKEASILAGSLGGRNFHFGVREHGMGFTHDSVGLGEDGPTHQPVEQLSTLRAIPNFTLIRPADASETAEAWRAAIKHTGGPVGLALTRQKLGFIDRTKYGSAAGVARGAYVLAESRSGSARVVLIATGSEVALILEAHEKLNAEGIGARAVSMPSQQIFASQDPAYRDAVLPPGVPRVSVEAAHPMSWHKWIGAEGVIIGIDRFGASAPYTRIYEELGLTVDRIVAAARALAPNRD